METRCSRSLDLKGVKDSVFRVARRRLRYPRACPNRIRQAGADLAIGLAGPGPRI